MRTWILLLIAVLMLVIACEAEPTPFPAAVPVTPSPTPEPTTPPPIRYALAPNTIGAVPVAEQLEGAVEMVTLEALPDASALGEVFDLVVAYGTVEGWSQAPVMPNVALVINPDAQRLNAEFAAVLREAVDTRGIIDALAIPGMEPRNLEPVSAPAPLRTRLANLGRPDGFDIRLGYASIPGVGPLTQQWERINVTAQPIELDDDAISAAFDEGQIQAALVRWTNESDLEMWREQFGSAAVLDLYTLPLSYLAVPALELSFTPSGWPLAQWS